LPNLDPELLACAGPDINRQFLLGMTTSLGYPMIFLEIRSPLDATLRTHGTHPPAFLWSIVRSIRNARVTYHIGRSDSTTDTKIEVQPSPLYPVYSLLTAPVIPTDVEQVADCVNGFRTGNSLPDSLRTKLGYSNSRLGVESIQVLSEFDGRTKHFANAIPLTQQPWALESARSEIKQTISDLREAWWADGQRNTGEHQAQELVRLAIEPPQQDQ
jgi:hypothetical protein